MNITNLEFPFKVIAKTCGYKDSERKIAYSVVDTYHSLYLDKMDIISAQLHACEQLLKYTLDTSDREIMEKEIAQLAMTLDMMTLK
jgi:hypothetical protein